MLADHLNIVKEFRKIGNSKHSCRNELDKDCFRHDAVYSDNEDLAK